MAISLRLSWLIDIVTILVVSLRWQVEGAFDDQVRVFFFHHIAPIESLGKRRI